MSNNEKFHNIFLRSRVRVGEWNLANKTNCVRDDYSQDSLDIDELIPQEDFNRDRENKMTSSY